MLTYFKRITLLLVAALLVQDAIAEVTTEKHFSLKPSTQADVKFIVYGDMRFTDPAEVIASRPGPRRALVKAIHAEAPAAIFLNGDVPWHGGVVEDYQVYQRETESWKKAQLPVYPALGNHEFARCEIAVCLQNWWDTFPELSGVRWYSVQINPAMRAIALDTDAPLLEGSAQREWLDRQLASFSKQEKFVMLYMHHPPLADLESGDLASHNPRNNELALAQYLATVAKKNPGVRFLVVAGHIHNYERMEQDGIVYLVSGGGGAKPYPVTRSEADLFKATNPVNFHYLRMILKTDRLSIEMIRLTDPEATTPEHFEIADHVELISH